MLMFQFPSSGKVHPNLEDFVVEVVDGGVSIPFKRESPSKREYDTNGLIIGNESFNSLQAGKSIQTLIGEFTKRGRIEFQFPSSGKVHPNVALTIGCGIKGFVSIPFKRESPSKLGITRPLLAKCISWFQFPSSGKVHPNLLLIGCGEYEGDKFQFPSSGKVHPNAKTV